MKGKHFIRVAAVMASLALVGASIVPVFAEETAAAAETATATSSTDYPIINSLESDENTVMISAVATVPEGFTPDAFVQIQNDETQEVYEVVAYEEDAFTGSAFVPAGSYTVIDSGIVGDANDEFPVEDINPSSFTVDDGAQYTISMTLANYDEVDAALGNTAADATEVSTDETTESDTTDTSDTATAAEEQGVYPWRVVAGGNAGDLTYDGMPIDAYDVQIKISHSGKIGTGTFRLTLDGGTSWSPDYDIVKDYEIKTMQNGEAVSTGITLHFNEDVDYKIDTTYSFSTLKEWEVEHQGTGTGVFYAGGVPESAGYAIVIKFIESGVPGEATYEISTDGGRNYSDETVLPEDGTIDIGDSNVSIQYDDGDYVAGDVYRVQIIGVEPVDHTTTIILAVCGVIAGIAIIFVAYLLSRKAKKSDFEIVK